MNKFDELLNSYTATDAYQDSKYAPLTAVIANSLDAYGVEVNGLKNVLDDNGVYYKVIASVDMDKLDWSYSSQYKVFQSVVDGIKHVSSKSVAGNIKAKGFDTKPWNSINNTNKMIAVNDGYHQVGVTDYKLTDVDAFKSSVKGIKLYFELEVPKSVIPTLTITETEI